MLCFAFGLVAEIERNLISMRTKEALALRRRKARFWDDEKEVYTKLQILIDHRSEIIQSLKEVPVLFRCVGTMRFRGIRSIVFVSWMPVSNGWYKGVNNGLWNVDSEPNGDTIER